jgi:hypothetical protein
MTRLLLGLSNFGRRLMEWAEDVRERHVGDEKPIIEQMRTSWNSPADWQTSGLDRGDDSEGRAAKGA